MTQVTGDMHGTGRGCPNGLYVGWGRRHAWGESLAADLGARVLFTQESQSDTGGIWGTAPIRYVGDLRRSLSSIADHKPSFLVWQVPPSVGPVLVRSSHEHAHLPWGLDVHSGAVNVSKWRWMLPALRWAAKRAVVTVVHNAEIAALIRPWPSPVVVVNSYVVPEIEVPRDSQRKPSGSIVVVASGSDDEPLGSVVGAAELVGNAHQFIITGRTEVVRARMGRPRLPANVLLSGLLPRREYLELLASCSVAVCLTNRAATMQLGAWEAVSLGCPVVVSDHAVLREYFRNVAEFTTNSSEDLAACILRLVGGHSRYAEAAEHMAMWMRATRERQVQMVRECLGV